MKLLPKGTNILDGVINLFAFLAGVLFIYLMLSVFVEAVSLVCDEGCSPSRYYNGGLLSSRSSLSLL